MISQCICLGHRTSVSINTNSIFGNAPFSSVAPPSSNVNQKFPVQQPSNFFPAAPFPSNSHLFSQRLLCSSQYSPLSSSQAPTLFSLSLQIHRICLRCHHPHPFMASAKSFNSKSLLDSAFSEHYSATVSGSAVSQSVWQPMCQFDESVSLMLLQSNKAPRFEASRIKFIFLSSFAFSFLRTLPKLTLRLPLKHNRKDRSNIWQSETALSLSTQY